MLDSTTRRLLVLLGIVAALAGLGIGVGLGLERLQAARAGSALHEGQVRRLQESLPTLDSVTLQRDSLKTEVQRLSARFYAPNETDPYAFGAAVRRKLSSLGITVLSYQLVDVKGKSFVEFSVTGGARAFVLFLRDVSESGKLWAVQTLTLSVREGSSVVDANFRIGYVVRDS